MKIVILAGGDNGGGGWWLSEAINRYTEHEARSVRMTQSYLQYGHDLLASSDKEIRALCNWADVIHLRDGSPIKNLPDKPIVITYTGRSFHRRHIHLCHHCRQKGYIVTVSTLNLTNYCPDDGLIWLPNPRDDMAHLVGEKHERFTICQAPTFRDRKGTELVIRAYGDAWDEVDLELVEKVPYAECIQRKARCHALVDQFHWGHGNNAIEAWAMGLVVLTGVDEEPFARLFRETCGGLPFVRIKESVRSLRSAARRLRDDPEFYQEQVEIGRDHFFRFHHTPVVAKRAIKIYEMARETQGAAAPKGQAQKPVPFPAPAVIRNRGLNILSVGEWDYAGCGYFLSEAINRHTRHHSRAVAWATSTLCFPRDIENPKAKDLRDLWKKADVIHIHDSVRRLPLRLPNKPTVITHHGTRYRSHPAQAHKVAKGSGWLLTVATPDLTLQGPRWLPDCRPDLAEYVNRPDGATIVAHAPTKRGVKSTGAVIGARIEGLDLIENVPWEQCLRRKGKAAVTIDQFKLGYGCNAIEAWAMGQAVIGYGSPAILAQIKQLVGFLPFVACEPLPAAIKAAVERLRADSGVYKEAVDRGQDCYHRFHAPEEAARRALVFYEEAIARGPAGHLQEIRRGRKGRSKPVEVGAEGLTLVEYIGPNKADMAWWGEATDQRYDLGGVHKRGYVDKRDVPNLLEATDKRGRTVFRVVK